MSRKVLLASTAMLLVAIFSVPRVHGIARRLLRALSDHDVVAEMEESEQIGTSSTAVIEPLFAPDMGPDDWPQFLGPGGLGHAAGDLPTEWSEKQNITWKVAVPGHGHSSPVVKDGRVWLTTAEDEGKSLQVLCIDVRDGKMLKQIEVFRQTQPGKIHARNSYATPTPVIDGQRIYVHFGSIGTACLSVESGAVLWRNDELKINHGEGPASSPVLCDGVLVIPFDGMDNQFLAGLDADNGRVRWKVPRHRGLNGSVIVTAYSTPLAVRVNHRTQVISTAVECASAHDPRTGEEIWHVEYQGFSNVPRPLLGHDKLFLCTGYGDTQMWAVVPGTGNVTATHVAWKARRQIPTVSSPVLSGNEIFMVTEQGILSCLDADTGNLRWRERLGHGFSASPIVANGKLFLFDEDGTARVLAAGCRYQLLRTNRLDAGCMASPAVTGNALIIRTRTCLYRIENHGG